MNTLKNNPLNDRMKRDYLVWLKEAKQRSATTVEQVRHAIDRLEVYNDYKDFGTFNKEQARAFKQALLETKNQRSGKTISISTVHHTLQAIKDFLAWLHEKPRYGRRIILSDIAFLNLTKGEERQARTSTPRKYASLQEYRTALFAMPTDTEIQRRDQAIMALLLLTCMRDAALISLKLKHIDVARKYVFQDPRQVKTKFSKAIETFFYPVGDDVIAILHEWAQFLIIEKGFGDDDPLFPKTINGHDAHQNFIPIGIGREHWTKANHVRVLFKSAFERVGMPYVNPHSIRNTLTQFAYTLKLSPEEFKAWSQNMGHDNPQTTYGYGQVSIERQAEIIGRLTTKPTSALPDPSIAEQIAELVARKLGHNQTKTLD